MFRRRQPPLNTIPGYSKIYQDFPGLHHAVLTTPGSETPSSKRIFLTFYEYEVVYKVGSVEILWIIKKLTELLRQEGVSPPPCPTPIKIFFGQGLPKSN